MRIICKRVGDSIHDRSPNVDTIQISKINEKKKKIYIYISVLFGKNIPAKCRHSGIAINPVWALCMPL